MTEKNGKVQLKASIDKIDPRIIKTVEGLNKRLDYGDIDGLAQSIKNNGLREPLKVFVENGQVFLSQGHRRLKAIMTLIEQGHDIKAVPCTSEFLGNRASEESRLFDQLVCNDGKNYNMLEQGLVFKELQNLGWEKQSEIADKIGKSQTHISLCLTLANMSKKLQNFIVDGQIECSTMITLLREQPDENAVIMAISQAILECEEKCENGKEIQVEPKKQRAQIRQILGGEKKESPTKRLKRANEWAEELEIVMEGNAKYILFKEFLKFVKGETDLSAIEDMIRAN